MDRAFSNNCSCGRIHISSVKECMCGDGVIDNLPLIAERYEVKKPFIIADTNTYKAAGERVCNMLDINKIPYTLHIFEQSGIKPDEFFTGNALMHFDYGCDCVLAVGSGVINDISKIISKALNVKYIIVATAPSMDGYASATSSMERDGLKVSISSRCPDVIIGDTDILKNAPLEMLRSGLGDILAKYIAICEWRISNIINGEYYCETVAGMVRDAVKLCVENASGLLNREPVAVSAVFDALVLSGAAMEYAGCSRPASGVEHYISHILDMRLLAFGTPSDLHGIQCAVGTMYAARIYEKLLNVQVDTDRALEYVNSFDINKSNLFLRQFVGQGAEAMIKLEEKEGKYNLDKHRLRFLRITENYEAIKQVIREEIPSTAALSELFTSVGLPMNSSDIGVDKDCISNAFKASKDIRDKYVLSRLCWDLGIIDEITADL